jgi:hypothetical protein
MDTVLLARRITKENITSYVKNQISQNIRIFHADLKLNLYNLETFLIRSVHPIFVAQHVFFSIFVLLSFRSISEFNF